MPSLTFSVAGHKDTCSPGWAFFLHLEVKILLLVLTLLVHFHTYQENVRVKAGNFFH